MAYENLCMYCFKDLHGETICPHCGKDANLAVPQIQMMPGTSVYRGRFLLGRALGQDASGIVYTALDTKRGGVIRIREYLPRNCAQRLSDGSVMPTDGMEAAFEAGKIKLKNSVESVQDPAKRHFFFEENGTAYIAQRKLAAAPTRDEDDDYVDDEDAEGGHSRRIVTYIVIAAIVVLAVIGGLILLLNSMGGDKDDKTLAPIASPSASASVLPTATRAPGATWQPQATPTRTPYATATFAPLVDPELTWMDFTFQNDTNKNNQGSNAQPTKQPSVDTSKSFPTVNNNSTQNNISSLQRRLVELGWLDRATGSYDAKTKQAVKDFQNYINNNCSPREMLQVDGIAGSKTQQWLYASNIEITRPTPTPRPPVTPAPETGIVNAKSPARDVRAVQRKLIALGLMKKGSDDGAYGAGTTSAVRDFQLSVNRLQGYSVLEPTGTVDENTMAYLNYYVEWWEEQQSLTTPTPTPKPKPTTTPAPKKGDVNASSSRTEITRVQGLLAGVGMLENKDVDGVYGKGTVAAVKNFQNWINEQRGSTTLQVTGVCDPLTQTYLEYCIDNNIIASFNTTKPTTAPTNTPTTAPTAAPTATLEPVYTEVPPEQQPGAQGITPESAAESISFMQEMLEEIGLLPYGSADGNYGPATREAVRRLQQIVNEQQGKHALDESGICDVNTLKALEYAYDRGMQLGATDEPTQAPTAEPTVTPTQTPTQKPVRPTRPATGEISGLSLQINGKNVEGSIELPQGKHDFTWAADGELDSYIIRLYDGNDNLIKSAQNTSNGFKLDTASLTPGEVYELQIGAVPLNGNEDNAVWKTLYFNTPMQSTPEPTAEPTEAPTPEPVVVGTITTLDIFVNGQAVEGSVELAHGVYEIAWKAQGELENYSISLYDGNGNLIKSAQNLSNGFNMDTDSLTPGEIYELQIGALPTNGGEDDMLWKTIYFIAPPSPTEAPTPEPTEAPTPKPSVSKPSIQLGSAAYQRDGVPYINDSTVIFSWMADGEVENYIVRLLHQNGTDYTLGETTDTSRTVPAEQLEPGLYKLYVGARPYGGTNEDIIWNELLFGVPEPEPTPAPVTPEPEVPSTPAEPEAPSFIDRNSAFDDIRQMQMRLYVLGLLPSDAQEGVLDEATLMAVAAFQTRVNEQLGDNTLLVIDPSTEDFVDAQTLELLFDQSFNING